MFEYFVFFRGLAIGLLLALVLVTLLLYRKRYTGKVLAFFCVCVVGYLFAPLLYQRSFLFVFTDPLANATPLAFLLFTQAFFEDHRKPATLSLALGLFYIALSYSSFAIRSYELAPSFAPSIDTKAWVLGRIAMVGVLLYSLFTVVRHWREDLVERRRLMRLIVVGLVGVSILSVVLIETILGMQAWPMSVHLWHTGLIILSIVVFGYSLIQLGSQQFVTTQQVHQPAGELALNEHASSADKKEVMLIVEAMQNSHIYRDMNFSLRQLAEHLGIPEHRLRAHINQQLGYRNFNDFVNQFRIAEVREKLISGDYARIPVLTIAMDAGYRSLSTFNRAFKSIEQLTPKEFRQNLERQ